MDTDEHLLGEAARWSARLAATDCSEKERAAHAHWLSGAPERRAAFEQVSRAAAEVSRAIKLDRRLQLLAEQAFAAKAVPDSRRPLRIAHCRVALAAAAGIACVSLAVWCFVGLDGLHAGNEQALLLEAPARSPLHTTLADGTVVHIDAGGKLQVRVSTAARQVELESGRAYFEVAHDARRPFSVTANGTRTVALGTKFEVRRAAAGAVVTLAEGSVAVSGTHGVDGHDSNWQTRLQPGEQLDVDVAKAETKLRKVDAQEVTGWSRGWLEFRNAPLADALHEINRYSVKRIVVADDALLHLHVAGSFVAGDTQAIIDAIAAVLPIRVVDGGNREIILFKRYEN